MSTTNLFYSGRYSVDSLGVSLRGSGGSDLGPPAKWRPVNMLLGEPRGGNSGRYSIPLGWAHGG